MTGAASAVTREIGLKIAGWYAITIPAPAAAASARTASVRSMQSINFFAFA